MAFSNKQRQAILLLEVGWCSLANAAHEPWDYTKSDETAGPGAAAASSTKASSAPGTATPTSAGS